MLACRDRSRDLVLSRWTQPYQPADPNLPRDSIHDLCGRDRGRLAVESSARLREKIVVGCESHEMVLSSCAFACLPLPVCVSSYH